MSELSKATIGEVVRVRGADVQGEFVVICEHASQHIPDVFQDLGLSDVDRKSHAVWDPGALEIAQHLADFLDAPLISGTVSRLVYDLNRPPDSPGAMPVKTELVEIPGNVGLSDAARRARADLVYVPFCAAVNALLDQRASAGLKTKIITVHTFSPHWFGQERGTEIGILHDSDARLADRMLERSRRVSRRCVARNQPYGPADGVTHSLQSFGLSRGLENVMIEVRNDLVTSSKECVGMASELLDMLESGSSDVGSADVGSAGAGHGARQ